MIKPSASPSPDSNSIPSELALHIKREQHVLARTESGLSGI